MSTWGLRPWENDAAVDWFNQTIAKGQLPSAVEKTLQLKLPDHAAEIRSAVAVLILLGRSFIWDGPAFAKHLRLAIARLDEIRSSRVYSETPDTLQQISHEIELLNYRLEQVRASVTGETILPSESLVKWWTTWL